MRSQRRLGSILIFLLALLGASQVHAALQHVTINSITTAALEGPLHHGLLIETNGIQDPNLTSYEVQLKEDLNLPFETWRIYSQELLPHDGRHLVIPYRNGTLALQGGKAYCVRVRALYGVAWTPWAEQCAVTVTVPDAGSEDQDGDGLSDLQEYALGTDPRDADTDLDGHSDGDEVVAGTDPHRRSAPYLLARTLTIDFGLGHPLGTYPNQHQFLELENIGDEPAQIHQLSVQDLVPNSGQAASFHLGVFPLSLSHLPPDNVTYIPISFLPTQGGEFRAEVLVDSNSADPVSAIPLKGQTVPLPDCQVSVSELNFGRVPVTQREPAFQQLTLRNAAPADADENATTHWSFTVDTDHMDFAPALRQHSLKAGEDVQVPVLFRNWKVGTHAATLTLRSDSCPPQQIALRAEVTGEVPAIQVSATEFSFGAEENEKRLTIQNTGAGPLYLYRTEFRDPEQFKLIPPGYFSGIPVAVQIPAAESREFVITARSQRPASSSAVQEEAVLYHNDPQADPIVLHLEKQF